ncbi:MAG: hypothetical protein RL005_1544 [Planctomycetota bacterium]
MLLAALILGVAPPSVTIGAPGSIDFTRDIRPILADRCFACHGPDSAARKAGLRLDTRDGALAALGGGRAAIVPGDRARSALLARLREHDPDRIMPPPELKRPLQEDQIHLLERWVEEGAPYAPHWAFVAPGPAPAQAVGDPSWARDPVDRLIQARFEQAGLEPSPHADRATLVRRASLALTGLAPTPEEVDAFVADQAPGAYERRIDAMLGSRRAAEHMATAWLDLARYADTYGYQTDGPSFTWPWRDWLLQSLDRNEPYDRFVTHIVAGDLVEAPTTESRTATAFHRLHRMTEEGGSIAEEFRQEGIADRVSTFGTAFLGLTLECARCHDHKYDPIPTEAFYGLAAMFGRVDENGMKSFAHGGWAPPPTVRLATPDQRTREQELQAKVDTARRAWHDAVSAGAARLPAPPEQAVAIDLPPPDGHWPLDRLEGGASPSALDPAAPATTDRHRGDQLGTVTTVPGRIGDAIAFDGDGGLSLTGTGGLSRHSPVSVSFWLRLGEQNQRAAVLHSSGFYSSEADGSGVELLLSDGRLRWSIMHLWPGSAASIESIAPLPTGSWMQVIATYDGLSRADGLSLWIDGEPLSTRVVRDGLDGPIAGAALELGSRSRDAGLRGGMVDDLRVWRRCLTRAELAIASGRIPTEAERREHHAVRSTERELDALRSSLVELAAHLDGVPALMCMQDSPFAPPTHVLQRGAYDQPDRSREVLPGAIDAVLPMERSAATSRRELARWLVDPRHPLTARVEVNRLWAQVFGRGLVETMENFGAQGAVPVHQDVLDLLAHDFVHGPQAWDRKAMLRRLVLSATFRQSSSAIGESGLRDPGNALYARGPAVRLTAEEIRDQAMHAAGLLAESFGGPSVRPWQQPGLAEDAGQGGIGAPDTGAAAHRRSLYTFRKRTVPPPTMLTFDAGSREACQARRGATTTPMQALAILNDPIFVECAQALAARAWADGADAPARVDRAFRLACSRSPDAEEREALLALVRTQADAINQDQARALCGEADPSRAALVLACSTILASDAFIMSR